MINGMVALSRFKWVFFYQKSNKSVENHMHNFIYLTLNNDLSGFFTLILRGGYFFANIHLLQQGGCFLTQKSPSIKQGGYYPETTAFLFAKLYQLRGHNTHFLSKEVDCCCSWLLLFCVLLFGLWIPQWL